MGCYLTTNFAQCQVYLSRIPLQGGSMYHASLPSVQGTIIYDAEAFNNLYPGYISVPLLCKGRSGAPSSPPVPPPPQSNPDPPAPPEPGPITGDPPPEECGAGPGIIKDDKTTGSSWWNGGSGGGAAKTDGNGAFDRMAQPLVIGITPVPTFDADAFTAKPVYTQEPHFEIRSGEKHAIVDAYHEGTGVGALVFHPPELQDFQLHGDGSNPGSRWATNLSEPMLLLHSAASANGGDSSFTVLAFGGLHRTTTNRPKSGVYFRFAPGSPSVFTLAPTDGNTADTDRAHFRLDDLCFDLGQYSTANRGALSPRAGSLIWNTTNSRLEFYDGSAWVPFGGSSLSWPLEGPDDGDPAYMFDAATVLGSDTAGMKFDTVDAEGPGLFDITGTEQLYINTTGVVIPNKLTVGGLIDPTGLELTPVAANPGGTAAYTMYLDDGANYDAGSFVFGTSTTPVTVPGVFNIHGNGVEQNSVAYVGTTQTTPFMVTDHNDAFKVLGNFHKHSTGKAFTDGAVLAFSRSRSTGTSHGALNAGDYLGSILWAGHDGTDYNPSARIAVQANSAFDANDTPGKMLFHLSPERSNALGLALTIGADKSLTSEGSFFMLEKASADTDRAGYGQLWVKNDTPNKLYFTDDAGTDHDLTRIYTSVGTAGANTTSNTTGVTTGLTFTLPTGEYIITIMTQLTSAAMTTAPQFTMQGSGGLVVGSFELQAHMNRGAATYELSGTTALGTFTAGTAGPGATAQPCTITARVRVTTAGTITLWLRSEVSGSTVTMVEGSGYAMKVA
ncbi:MAG: hypothetical protein M5U25_21110 [Planctomycetota bacterium]|nr:hypothetical protein [Planctomycetota bacterium]